MPHQKYSEGAAIEHRDPDRGHQMKEGEMMFDKGYETSNKNSATYYGDHERGNRYMQLQNEAASRDEKKIKRSKFSKIA